MTANERSLWDSRAPRFYDAWEAMDPAAKQPIVRKRLMDYLEFAKSGAEFYAERLVDVDWQSEQPLHAVPVMQAEDLRRNLPMAGTALLTCRDSSYTVFQSGGTTGLPKTTLFSHGELEGLNLPNARGFYAVGLRPEDRVANLFAVGGLYMTLIHTNRMLQQYGCMNFPFSNHTPYDFVDRTARLYNINCFTGIASVVLSCLRDMMTRGTDGLKIDKIFYGGEHLYEADRQELTRKLGVKIVAAPGYGTVDTWYLGYQCDQTGPGVFHTHDDQVYIEILREDGTVCSAGETGMLHATAFPRRITPTIRYRVGDRARWIKESCACGRTTPLFQLLGRGDDVLRVGYDSVDYAAIQALVTQIDGLTGMVQMQKSRIDGKDQLTIRVESETAGSRADELATILQTRLLADRPSIRDFVSKGTIHPLNIEILAIGALPLNPRTGKLIRVIDAL